MNTTCPNCGAEMEFKKVKKTQYVTLKGLPENKNRLMEVVEFWDSGYNLYPDALRFYHCEECADKRGTLYCDFVLFKNGEVYGFQGLEWVKMKMMEKVDFT